MKRLLFCYDGPLKKDEENEYYGTSLTDEVFKRYEVIAENINIAIRVRRIKENDNISRYTKITKEKYNIIECPNISSIKGLLFRKKECKKILEEKIKDSDYVIARLPSMIGNLSIDIAKKLNKPYLIELVGCPWDALWNYSLKGKMFAPIMTYITKKRIKTAPYVLYVTKEFLQRRYPTKGKSINCSNVLLNDIDEKNLKIRRDRIYRNEENPVKVIATTAAVNVKYKGQKYVIKAINELKKKGMIFEYWIIGGGNNSYLKKFVKKYKLEKQIKFLGALPHNMVFEKLKNVDIYIQPSKQEGLPRALIEAMSIGCLCIGSQTGGIPELLEDNYIFKKGNVKQLVNIIKNVKTEDYIEQGKKNFEKSKDYKKEILENRRNNFYKEFARNSEGRDV